MTAGRPDRARPASSRRKRTPPTKRAAPTPQPAPPATAPSPATQRRPSLFERLAPPIRPVVPGAWPAGRLRVLAVLADTFVAGDDAPRRAALAAERIDRFLERSQARQLRMALRLMDTRLANLVLTGRPVKLTRMDRRARERYVAGWGSSRLALRRGGYTAFRRLLTYVAYADPGAPDAPNPRLAEIGYAPAREPLTDDPTRIAPLVLPPDAAGVASRLPVELEADVVVVGSGAGGGVMALELAKAGRSVLVVEAGPLLTEPDMPRDELGGFDRLFLQGGFAATWDGSIQLLAGAGVGGGTTVNWATCLPPPDVIREEWARQHGLDGFDGAEMDADLDLLRQQIGLVPPAVIGPKDDAIIRGARALGLDGGPTTVNAVGCGACGLCAFGCVRGAKRSTLRVHLREAAALGARILPGVAVDQVTISAARVTGVTASIPRPDGSRRQIRIRAPQVVVSAGPLRTPGILERSSVGHAALGKFLRIHPVSAVVGRYEAPVDMWDGAMQGARSLAFAPGSGRVAPAAAGSGPASVPGFAGGFTIESVPVHPGILASALPWASAADHRALMADARFYGPLIAITRDTDWGRVTPLRSGGARVDYRLAPGDVTQLREGLVALARIAEAAGAAAILAPGHVPEAWHRDGTGSAAAAPHFGAFLDRLRQFDFRPHRGATFSAHQMGTARMGDAPGLHVCDPRGRVRWAVAGVSGDQVVRGLYVADTSLFPTALGVNPMLTAMLLARRVARTVIAEGGAPAG